MITKAKTATGALRSVRRRTLRSILAKVKPLFYASGYREGYIVDGQRHTRPVQLVAVPEDLRSIDGRSTNGVFAIQEDGIITDTLGHGAVVIGWSCVCVEVLLLLYSLADKLVERIKDNR